MRWARSWMFCVFFYYPALWIALSCVWAIPGLFETVFSNEHIVEFRITAFGLVLWSAPANPAAHPAVAHSFIIPTPSWWVLIPLAAVVAITLVGAGRLRRILGGLTVAVLADVGLVLPFIRFDRLGHVSTHLILASVLFFGPLSVGQYWISRAWASNGYWGRVAGLWASTALLPLLLWLFFHLFRASRFGNFLWMLAPPAALAAVLASLRAPGYSTTDSQPMDSGAIVSGVAVTVLLVMGVTWGGPVAGQAFQQREEQENQAAMAKLPPNPVNAPYPRIFFQKGVSLSAEYPNPYASTGARQMLRALHADGVNAIALVPYGGMRLGSTEIHGFGQHSWESNEGLRELSRLAHAMGMKVMLKPGIWIGGGHFGGDIEFSSPTDREKWFANYGSFIERYARIAAEIHADLFCVGGEFVLMSRYDSDWRRIIANVRNLYPGPVTYAANFGEEFQNLKFWDALDYIGLQEYYPLPNDLSTGALVGKVEAVEERFHKPVIFTEVGFPSVASGNRRPWVDGRQGQADLQIQTRCYQSIFQAFYNKPWFEGMYWWKVGTNGFGGPNDTSLTPWGKPAMEIVAKWYKGGSRRDATLNQQTVKQEQTSPYVSR